MLTAENYKNGFLVDDRYMAFVEATAAPHTPDEDQRVIYEALVVDHTEGVCVHRTRFDTLEAALSNINQLPRGWGFESLSSCGSHGGSSGGEAACGAESCTSCGACH